MGADRPLRRAGAAIDGTVGRSLGGPSRYSASLDASKLSGASFSPKGASISRKGGVARSYADAPEIDGVVRLLPPEKASKTIKVGEFSRARMDLTLKELFEEREGVKHLLS